MTTNEIRKKYLAFFAYRGHQIVASDSLVPRDDPTLLFTGAGMNQFKEEFLGRVKDYRRAATCQKCLRTPDLENVGRTSGHHTFFEMLGNFSFGDYFKREAILWAWEFLTQELHLPAEKLFVSVYQDDNEAFEIWHKEVGLSKERIYRFGASENFWPANAPTQGPNGPCGPCSEIFYDRGIKFSCGRPGCDVSCSCGRYVEIWNLVFTQFDRQEDGSLKPLPNKNIDTGMGLERMAAVMQGVSTNFQIDIFKPVVEAICRAAETRYGSNPEQDSHIHAIADHVRAITFAVYDDVSPSNVGRGYVVRSLIRRAVGHGRALGMDKYFLYKLVPVVVEVMKEPYPELLKRRESISGIIQAEEKRYEQTLNEASRILKDKISELKSKGETKITDSGKLAFELYDTYGLPLDITEEIVSQAGYSIDQEQFKEVLGLRREQSRETSKMTGDIFGGDLLAGLDKQHLKTEFKEKEADLDARVIAIYKGQKQVDSAQAPDEVEIVLDQTPFYGETGGQVGDRGSLTIGGEDTGWPKTTVNVLDAKKINECIVHHACIETGKVEVNQRVKASIDYDRRMDIARNHTATHLLHGALRQVLGEHVKQAGSLVAPNRLRFDFTHFKEISREQLSRIERLVNIWIFDNVPVSIGSMNRDEAIASGAMALFGEKYGSTVRVVRIEKSRNSGAASVELCGGTHLTHTGDIHIFKIVHESSIAGGTRRIEALTGHGALEDFKQESAVLEELKELFKTPKEKIIGAVTGLQEGLRQAEREISQLRDKIISQETEGLLKIKETKGEVNIIVGRLACVGMDQLRRASDMIMGKDGIAVVVLGSVLDQKAFLLARVSDGLIKKGLKANDIINNISPLIGGRGGGKEKMAQGGGAKTEELDNALKQARKDILGKL